MAIIRTFIIRTFEVAHAVKSNYYGNGVVIDVSSEDVDYPITVLFEDGNVVKFTKEGDSQDDPNKNIY